MNTMGPLMNAWFALLDGNISVDVFKEDVPEEQTESYVLIRAEGETWDGNKRSFADTSVVVVDIVTIFENNIVRSEVETIDGEIGALILTTPGQNNLAEQSGMQIINVKRETSQYLEEQDGIKRYYRKVSRYVHTIYQTA